MMQPAVSGKRFEVGFHILNQWLHIRQNGKNLLPFFEDNLVGSIAIYGMGALGERLYQELKGSKVVVKYGIDRMASSKDAAELKLYCSDESSFPDTDIIVVTPVQDYWEIVRILETKTGAAIVSLADVIDYCIDRDREQG